MAETKKADELWTIGKILEWTKNFFDGKGIENPRLDAEVLLASVLGQSRMYLYVHYDQPLNAEELGIFRGLVKRRAQREPVAYLLERREFFGHTFKVTPAVLVPQPDTEILVEHALAGLKEMVEQGGRERLRIADIGTGSGAIILSLLASLPQAEGIAVDISPEALAVAGENAAALEVGERVEFRNGDLCAPLQGELLDAIVSNPPYIPHDAIPTLAPEVRHEPHLALDGGLDGLDFYRRLVEDAPAYIRSGGFLAMEIGAGEAPAVLALAEKNPAWGRGRSLKDLAGLDRVIILERK